MGVVLTVVRAGAAERPVHLHTGGAQEAGPQHADDDLPVHDEPGVRGEEHHRPDLRDHPQSPLPPEGGGHEACCGDCCRGSSVESVRSRKEREFEQGTEDPDDGDGEWTVLYGHVHFEIGPNPSYSA